MGNGQSRAPSSSDAGDTLASHVLCGAQDAIALIKGGDKDKSIASTKVTRGELHRLCVEFANTLRNNGVKPGDVVTIAEANTLEQVCIFLGCTYARAVAAPLNQNYTADEFKYYMKDANSKLLVTGAGGNKAAEEANVVPSMSVSVVVEEGKVPTLSVTGSRKLKDAAQHRDVFATDPPRADDVALFLHTSGTTSRPKGVPLSHSNLIASLRNIKGTYEFTASDVSLLVMPLFHVHGLMAGLLSPLLSGASVVLPEAGKFSAGTFWQDAVEHNVTFYTAVPTMHQILVSRADKDYPSKKPPPLRVIRSCSSSLAPATLFQVEKLFKAPVLEAYAMTEASHQMTSNPLPKFGERKPGTVGKPQGSVKVAILNDECKILGPGEIGEVCIQGPNVTKGYRRNPKANKEAFAGGWFHTGDQGYLSEDGYLSLTGRIKELINRGGEKISPLEVDATLLAHPDVAEAVSFAAPDDKYGEEVAAAVVLKSNKVVEATGEEAVASSIKEFCKGKISDFKIPKQIFITDTLPKNATGKIQRRFMVDAFINKSSNKAPVPSAVEAGASESATPASGYDIAATTLFGLGIRHMFGVIGIPVTQMASASQAAGIRFISCRNEQAAGYAAAAAGYLTGRPGVLLTVSGPGMVHGIAGLCHAKVNGWPMIMISGSCETGEVGKGAFQELDQCAAAAPYVKLAVRAKRPKDIRNCIIKAYSASMTCGFGPSYVDVPSDVFMSVVSAAEAGAYSAKTAADAQVGPGVGLLPLSPPKRIVNTCEAVTRSKIVDEIRAARRPLVVLGVGAATEQAEAPIRELISAWNIPFITASMARGVVPDSDGNCVNAARSMALSKADVVVVLGSPLSWQLHFGEPPKWSPDARFILIDNWVSKRDKSMAKRFLEVSIGAAAAELVGTDVNPDAWSDWRDQLRAKVHASKEKLELKLAHTAHPLNYLTTLRVIRDTINAQPRAPVVVAEGANTMDQARVLLEPVNDPRCRMDAGAWGTMGIGPGCAIAAAVTTGRSVVAVEGDSAFGFSGMEMETMCRYKLPIIIVVFNNGGIYGGDRREDGLRGRAARGLEKAGWPDDPAPTAFVPGARYDLLATAFRGDGYDVSTASDLTAALEAALASGQPSLINVAIDPKAGVESGTVHSFNFVKK